MGLAIANGFVEGNGGRITVESLPGQAVLRRAGPPAQEPVLRAGELAVDVRAHRLTVGGERAHLMPIRARIAVECLDRAAAERRG